MRENQYHDDRDLRRFKNSDEEFGKRAKGLNHNAIGLIVATIVAIFFAFIIGMDDFDFKSKFLTKAMNVVTFWVFGIIFTVFYNTRRFKQDETLFRQNPTALAFYLGSWILGTSLAVVLGN